MEYMSFQGSVGLKDEELGILFSQSAWKDLVDIALIYFLLFRANARFCFAEQVNTYFCKRGSKKYGWLVAPILTEI